MSARSFFAFDEGSAVGGSEGFRGFVDGPFVIIAFFALLAVSVYAFSIPEPFAAGAVAVFFLLISFVNPLNAVAFVLLIHPFFLGASKRQYFFMLEFFVYAAVVIGLVRLYSRGGRPWLPMGALVGALVAAAFFSVPVDFKKFFYELWVAGAGEQLNLWLGGHQGPHVYYLRTFANVAAGAALFMVAVNLLPRDDGRSIEKMLAGAVFLAAAVCVFGFLLRYRIIPRDGLYMSLSLVGGMGRGKVITAFSYNQQYLAQYLLLTIPFGLYFVYKSLKKPLALASYAAASVILVVTLAYSAQRSAYITILVSGALLACFGAWGFRLDKRKIASLLAVPLGLVAVMILADWLLLGGIIWQNLFKAPESFGHEPRRALWGAALEMAKSSPLLGVGSGRYFHFFPEFFSGPGEDWKAYGTLRGTAHSFYFQTLAEQGALGLALWVAFPCYALYLAAKAVLSPNVGINKPLAVTLAFTLVNWLTLGVFHNIAYIRSHGIFFWLVAAFLLSVLRPFVGTPDLRPRVVRALTFVLVVGFVWQVAQVVSRPLGDGFYAGFYEAERQTDGTYARWMGERGVISEKVEGGRVTLNMSAPLPGIAERPQRLSVWLDGEKHEEVFTDTGPRKLTLPVNFAEGREAVIWLETEYTFNPKKEGASGDVRDLSVYIKKPEWKD